MENRGDLLEFLDHFPIRLTLEPLETFASYIARWGKLWGETITFRDVARKLNLAHKFHPKQHSVKLDYNALAQRLLLSEQQLRGTTFHYIGEKLLWDEASTPKLLYELVTHDLRYCPLCIEEKGYYSLLWRLTCIPGCLDHNCYLVDACWRCQLPVPLIAPSLTIGVCNFCGANLAEGHIVRLTDEDRLETQVRTSDMVYLIQPQPQRYQLPIEKKLARIREDLGVSKYDVDRELYMRFQRLNEFENCKMRSRLAGCINYADYLGFSLREALAYSEHPIELQMEEIQQIRSVCETKRMEIIRSANNYEVQLLERVKIAAIQIEDQALPVSQLRIGKLLKVKISDMRIFPAVRDFLDEWKVERLPRLNRHRVNRIEEAIAQLDEQQERVTARRITQIVGFNIDQYSRRHKDIAAVVRSRLSPRTPVAKEKKTNSKTLRVIKRTTMCIRLKEVLDEAERRGEKLPLYKITEMVGTYWEAIQSNAEAIELANNYLSRIDQDDKARRINLIYQIRNELIESGRPVELKTFQQRLGIKITKGGPHNELWEIIHSLVNQYKSEKETSILGQVQQAVLDLRTDGIGFKFKDIGQRIGISDNRLKSYHSIYTYLNSLPELKKPLTLPKSFYSPK